jgi:hypothetical protein
VTGTFTFDSVGNLVGRPIAKMVVRNGTFEYLPDSGAPADLATRVASVPTGR